MTGWTGEVNERKRKSRHMDSSIACVVLPRSREMADDSPTPPRIRLSAQLPTPETGRRTSKRVIKPIIESSSAITSLPTPPTIPRTRTSPRIAAIAKDPSPSGRTTFSYSANLASSSRSESIRHKAGRTFNQQMGLSTGQASSSRHGAGVGMGGSRLGGQKIVPISRSRPIVQEEDNPFFVGKPSVPPASPGHSTRHRPREGAEEDQAASPRPKRKGGLSPPHFIADPIHSATSLLSPPQTQRSSAFRTGPPLASPRTLLRQTRQREKLERQRQMKDEDDNPFYIRPGQVVKHRPGPVVDERIDTVTYVFRGTKKVFANPFLGADERVLEAELDVEDPEFDPHPCPPPKLLWPTATPPRAAASTPPRQRNHRHVQSDDEVSPPSSPMHTPRGTINDRARFDSDDEFVPEEEPEEVGVTVKRGLLFGPGAMNRALGAEGSERRTKRRL